MDAIVIVPAFNKEISIGSMVLKIKKYVDQVIVVDDGSQDCTAEIARLAGAEVIKHQKNMGKGMALKTGFGIASQNGTKAIIAIDDNRFSDIIPEIIDYIKKGHYDMVINSQNGKLYKLGNKYYGNDKNNGRNKKVELLAFSIESLQKINLVLDGASIRNILYQAEKNNLKIKYLNFEEEVNLNSLMEIYNIGIVIPAYNEEKFIEKTINGIPKYVEKIYVIDDGSTDGTPEILKRMKDSRVLYIRHDKNRGVGAAIVTGYKLALEDGMDIVVVMAGDDQMDPEQLPNLLKPIIENNADYSKGNRLINKEFREGMSDWRSFGNALLTMITKIGSGYWNIMDPQNGYTAISRRTLEAIDIDSIYSYYGYCNDILIKLNTIGMKVEDVAIPARYGEERSKIKYSKYIVKVAPMIFKGFLWRLKTKYMILDFHPLVFFYFASGILLPSGGLLILWILYHKLYNNPISPNFPLLSVFITLMGLQLLLFAMFFDMQYDRNRRIGT